MIRAVLRKHCARWGSARSHSRRCKLTNVLERQIVAGEERLDLLERQDALERKRAGIDKDSFATGKDGQRLIAGSDLTTRTGIVAFLKSAGVNDEAVERRIANEFADSDGNVKYGSSPGHQKYGKSNPVKVAAESDANTLNSALRQLEADANRVS